MPSLQYNGPFLLGSLNQPIEQASVKRSVRDALGGPKLQAGLGRQTERARSTVADEEEAVTAPVPLKPTEIILVGLEACATAHHWPRELIALGHVPHLIPPTYVKVDVKRNKHDA